LLHLVGLIYQFKDKLVNCGIEVPHIERGGKLPAVLIPDILDHACYIYRVQELSCCTMLYAQLVSNLRCCAAATVQS